VPFVTASKNGTYQKSENLNHFLFSFPEEMDGLNDFLFVRWLLSSTRPAIKKSDTD